MKSPNDISSLFKMLGESPEHYQEIVRDVDARESRDRWPLIAAVPEYSRNQSDRLPNSRVHTAFVER